MASIPSHRGAHQGPIVSWCRLPLRHRLAVIMVCQSLTSLLVAFCIVYLLGGQLERQRIGEDLRARAVLLSELAAALTDSAATAPISAASVSGRLKAALSPVLTHARGLQQVNLFGRRFDRFYPLVHLSLGTDTAQAYAQARLDTSNTRLTAALVAPVVDAQVRPRGAGHVFSAYAPVAGPDGEPWAVLTVDMAPETLKRGMDHMRPVLGGVLVLAGLLALLLAHWLSRSFTRPIGALLRAADALADGDLHVQVPGGNTDELHRLAGSFNRLTTTVREHQHGLEESNRQLDLLNRQLRDTMVELEQANSDLAESREFFSTLVARTPWPIVVTDPDDHILLFNEAASELFGWRAADIVGDSFDRVFSQENRHEVREQLGLRIRRGKVWRGEFLGQTKSGDHPLLSATVSPVRDDHGSIVAYMYLAQDVTETRQLQNLIIQMERMSTRGEMAGEIAHEINNYLTILGGNLEVIPMLLAAGHQEKLEKKFRTMKDVLDKIAHFSSGLMGYQQTETRQAPCDLNRLIESLIDFLKPQNRFDNIHIQLTLADDLPEVAVDVGQIQQVLVNLLNNSADAIRERDGTDGRIEIASEWNPLEENLKIRIRDNGCGIPAAIVARLFRERYTSKKQGHGLGLLNCRRIIEGHHGRLEVESQEGNGAGFTLILPAGEVTEVLPPPLVRSASDR